jgi:hypothetical protein
MTEPEDFLTRWSRRKQGAKIESEKDAQVDANPQQTERCDASAGSEAKAVGPADNQRDLKNSEDVFDLSNLPSLDSIGPATDIRAFLQPGVPEALSRAALRRAWSADPAVRDFIGLAENSWDFTASDGMHGFGALDPADAKRLLAQLFSEGDRKSDAGETPVASLENAVNDAEPRQYGESDPDSPSEADVIASEPVPDANNEEQSGTDSEAQVRIPESVSAASQQETASAALQQKEAELVRASGTMSRGHGRALPQ